MTDIYQDYHSPIDSLLSLPSHPFFPPSLLPLLSSLSLPSLPLFSPSLSSLLQRVAPKGWTKEINTFTSTPIFTNCRTGERWALARDGSGNFYYYNMANSSLTVGELPAIDDVSVCVCVCVCVGGGGGGFAHV